MNHTPTPSTQRKIPARTIWIIIITIIIAVILLIPLIWYISLVYAFSNSTDYLDDVVLSSPSGEHQIIIREHSWGFGFGAEIYYKGKDDKKEQFVYDLGYRDEGHPINAGNYTVTWNGDETEVKIEYLDRFDSVIIITIADLSVKRSIVESDT